MSNDGIWILLTFVFLVMLTSFDLAAKLPRRPDESHAMDEFDI
jgi:hypothetical protein